MFQPPPKPESLLGYHRILSPNAAVKVSPLCLGGISIGSSWSSIFGKNNDPNKLLDTYFALGGNFVDTSNVYNSEDSEKLIGDWLELRGTRDQMVIATKYTAGFRSYNRANEPLQSNFTGNSVKSMHISVRESLKKLKTDYIDILYVHWWDFGTSVEEVMRGLHAHVMAKEVLYLGISDTPAWVVVKANACELCIPGFNLPLLTPLLETLVRTVPLPSRCTRAVGMPHTATWKPSLSPCVKIRAWPLCLGLLLEEDNFFQLSRETKWPEIPISGKVTRLLRMSQFATHWRK